KPGTLVSLGGNKYDADGYFGSAFGTVANGGNAVPYAPLELYLMGLVDKSAVAPIQVAVNGSFASQADASNGIFSADSIKTVSISDATVTEVDTGSTTASFQVKLSYPALKQVTVRYATANGTAGSADYTAAFDTLTFAPGDQVKAVKVAVTGDKLDESNETFF